jgi:nucleoside-diphosphate-sugar epimerase
VRGEPIKLVARGEQRRSFTDVSDGIDALMKILHNRSGIARGKIYNIGNPRNNVSIRQIAEMMLSLAEEIPEYRDSAANVQVIDVSASDYYGSGYQDIQARVPFIDNARTELEWEPVVTLSESLRRIFEHYRGELVSASALLEHSMHADYTQEKYCRSVFTR